MPIVFVRGLKGSALVNQRNSVKWMNPLEAAGILAPDLSLPVRWHDGVQEQDELVPRPTPEKVPLLPWSLCDIAYAPWIKAARKSGRPFYEFAYDWRRDLLESLKNFEAFMTQVHSRHPGERIQVVAHSMGGYLTLALLNLHPEAFSRVVFVGVPFAGGVAFLPDMTHGSPTALNRRILSPRVLFTFPSIYCLFPEDGSIGMADAEGRPIEVDFFRPEEWRRLRLGVFADESWKVDSDKMHFLTTVLDHCKQMKQLMKPRPHKYPPIFTVLGMEQATFAKAMRRETDDGTPTWDFKALPSEPGDGRVCASRALPPEGIPYTVFHSKAEHSAQLNDPEVIKLILEHR